MSQPDSILTYQVLDGRVGVLTLNRPPVNALSTGLWQALSDAMDRLAEDERVNAAILTGQGTKAFSAGADVKEMVQLTPVSRRQRQEFILGAMARVADLSIPLICAINGPAAGGGVNLATLCDYRIAADHAHFSLPEIDRGTVSGGGVFLRRIGVSSGAIRELLYTGRRVPATEALSMRLVDCVVPGDQLMPRAMSVATAMASKARDALVLMKRAVRIAESKGDWLEAYRATNDTSLELAGSPEAREGMAAFLEKRQASYGKNS